MWVWCQTIQPLKKRKHSNIHKVGKVVNSTSTESIVRNKSNVIQEIFDIIKNVDDYINIDFKDKADDVENLRMMKKH